MNGLGPSGGVVGVRGLRAALCNVLLAHLCCAVRGHIVLDTLARVRVVIAVFYKKIIFLNSFLQLFLKKIVIGVFYILFYIFTHYFVFDNRFENA